MKLEGMPWHEIVLKTGVQTNKHIKKMRDAIDVSLGLIRIKN